MDPRQDPNHFVFGKHITYFEEPDIIFMRLAGDCSDEEGLELVRRQMEFSKGRKMLFFLMDGREMSGISSGARRAVAQSLKAIPLYGMAIYEAPMKARVVAKLVITAINLFRQDATTNPVEFFPSETRARQWIMSRREEYKHVLT
jgi:hypothetical protein